MHELYDLRETLCKQLKAFSKKSDITGQSLEIVDTLAHSIKNIDKVIERNEEMDGVSMDSYRGRSWRSMYRGNYEGYDDSERGRSYDRGRGENMVSELREMMRDTQDERKKMEIQKLISKFESM